MPPTFYSGWTFAIDGAAPVDVPIKSQYCRDVASYAMCRGLYNVFSTGRDIMTHNTTDISAALHAWWKWLRDHTVQFTCMTAQPAGTDWMREYSMPLIINKLRNKFPSVEFTQTTYSDGFSSDGIPAMSLRGDYEIFPAFYWSTYLVRLANAEGPRGFISQSGKTIHDWQDANTLIARQGFSSDHTRAWAALCDGTAPSGLLQFLYQSGPISTASLGSSRPVSDDALAAFMAMPKYSRWFTNESA